MSVPRIAGHVFAAGCVLGALWCPALATAQNIGPSLVPSDAPGSASPHAESAPKLHWKLEDPLSSARYALAASTAPDDAIFAIGGASGSSVLTTVDVFLPHGNRWVPGPSLPSPRYRHAAATGGDGRIYVIGGGDPFGAGLLNSVLGLTPGSQQWTPVAAIPTPRQLLGATTGTDGRIYAVGGHNFVALNVIEIFNPSTNQWAGAAPMPTARYDMGVATGTDGRIYAIGGSGDGVFNVLDVVEAYSPLTNSWAAAKPLPIRRALVNAVTAPDGRIYVIGGCELITDAGGNPVDCVDTKRVDVYSPETNTWQTVEPTIAAHREGAVVLSNKRIYAISGHTTAVESAK